MNIHCRIPYLLTIRNFSMTGIEYKGYNNKWREGRMMDKLMNGRKSKPNSKRYYPDFDVMPNVGGTTNFFDFIGNQSGSSKPQRRLVVLNKMLMRNISDILSTGELCPNLHGRGLHLSKVAISPTLNVINVHWLANGNEEEDSETSKRLAEIAPSLRHSLSQLSLMGSIPRIEFVKDCKYIKFVAVENLLKKADFGEDFVPTPLANDWRSETVLQKSIPEHLKDKIREAESNADVCEEPLPAMQMNVLGLNQETIMNKVKAAVEKMKAKHRKRNAEPLNVSSDGTHVDGTNFAKELNTQERKKLFREYLHQRHIAWKKAQKKEKKENIEKVMYEKDFERSIAHEFMADVYEELDESDFDHECLDLDEDSRDEVENRRY
ncbi:hypothetical protein LSTR_LSTR008623 [Laodelphax striatellus]|uniref:Ribosome-binding factor A, mitochondrial n=1 Tax=Laodelphax striatellus TaxID=195883 RepID=A0A482WZY3_LAOST|nr:hypothetical protein LSTR_LSTR008623 [Laodelphax striatellus]